MRKLSLIISFGLITAAGIITGCKKKETPPPATTTSTTGTTSTTSTTGTVAPVYLVSKVSQDGVDQYSITYDSANRISKVTMLDTGGWHQEYVYQKDGNIKINFFDKLNRPTGYTFINMYLDRISQIHGFRWDPAQAKFVALRNSGTYNIDANKSYEYMTFNRWDTAETYYHAEYQSGSTNAWRVTLALFDAKGMNNTPKTMTTYEFDDKHTPMNGKVFKRPDELPTPEFFNKNNITKMTVKDIATSNLTVYDITYEYNSDGYPTKATLNGNGDHIVKEFTYTKK